MSEHQITVRYQQLDDADKSGKSGRGLWEAGKPPVGLHRPCYGDEG